MMKGEDKVKHTDKRMAEFEENAEKKKVKKEEKKEVKKRKTPWKPVVVPASSARRLPFRRAGTTCPCRWP